MLALLENVLSSTRWSFVWIMTIISLILWMLWYGKIMFWPWYMKWMHLGKTTGNSSMLRSLIYEFISRILYFIGLWWIFITRGRLDLQSVLSLSMLVWLVYIFATQLSLISRSSSNKKVLWIITVNTLIQNVIAAIVFVNVIR